MNNILVILDRAHGNNTPGKGSPWSLTHTPPELPFKEWEYSREIISRLTPILEQSGYLVYNLVPEDEDISLAERGKRVNSSIRNHKGYHAICISIHNNAAGNGKEWKKAYGWSVWTTPGQNNSDLLAQCLYDSAVEILTPIGQRTRKDVSDGDADYEANFAMCRMPNCPAVLVEAHFQDCIDEVKFLTSPEGKQAQIEIIKRGIDRYCKLKGWI